MVTNSRVPSEPFCDNCGLDRVTVTSTLLIPGKALVFWMKTWLGGGSGAESDTALLDATVAAGRVGAAWLTAGREGRFAAHPVKAITTRTAVNMRTLRLLLHRFHCSMSFLLS